MRYYAMRTDQESRDLLFKELMLGKFRQGWGYQPGQDLRLLKVKVDAGQKLSDKEASAWRNRRMLGGRWGINEGTRLLLPNMPRAGRFMLVEVTGPYEFDILRGLQDYGHILPIKIPGQQQGFSNNDPRLPARLRQSLRCRSRGWSLDEHETVLAKLWDDAVTGQSLQTPRTTESVLKHAYATAVETIRAPLLEKFLSVLEQGFYAAQFEAPCHVLLQKIYPEAEVEHTGGSGEHGADLVVSWQDPLIEEKSEAAQSWQVVVQVKCWKGTADDLKPIEQIREAYHYYQTDGPVRAGLIMTLCSDESEQFREHREEVAAEIKIPIKFLDRKRMGELFLEYGLLGNLNE